MAALLFTVVVVAALTPNKSCKNGNNIASDITENTIDSKIVTT
jgi:hypothetical protein